MFSLRSNLVILEGKLLQNSTDLSLSQVLIEADELSSAEMENQYIISYNVKMRSYSITQLLHITEIIRDLFNKITIDKSTEFNGELMVRTYHTTTSFIVNEHEYGSYLDLHYKFAKESVQDTSLTLHTVRALENRADFNHFDHDLASKYETRQLIIPIVDVKLELGGIENFYILVTFGPRTFSLFFRFHLYK